MSLQFNLIGHESKARAGVLQTDRGEVQTPIFMPVGTAGTVKAIDQERLENEIQAEIILGNTYHLYLRPTLEILKQAGGLHRFIGWNKPILTDSGGYQVYSLAANRKITDRGVSFKSHIDGSSHLFTPEKVIDMQRLIGSDIMMAFDECPPYPCEYEYAKTSLDLTHKWMLRCQKHFNQTKPLYSCDQSLFPIVQGSTYRDLRKESAEFMANLDLPGIAIGGLSVGEPVEEMYATVKMVCDILPWDKPRYLMGVGTPANILQGIELGVDMFDCVMPTRNARNGMLFTTKGIINIKNQKWKNDFNPIDAELENPILDRYNRAYLRHLFVSGEMLGPQLATLHNLSFYLWLIKKARSQILNGTFTEWKLTIVNKLMRKL